DAYDRQRATPERSGRRDDRVEDQLPSCHVARLPNGQLGDPATRQLFGGMSLLLLSRPKHDGHTLVEAVAARNGGHFLVVGQRQVHDSPLDRSHRRKELLATVSAYLIGHLACLLLELFDSFSFELLTIELDVFVEPATDQRF